jgi:hypothetical protein
MNRIAGVLLVAAAGATLIAAGCSRSKKLIEWGWDEPDPAFMRAHIEELEASPFDGIVYHLSYATPEGKPGNFSWQCWGRKAFTMDDLAPALADLRATPFRRLTDNFLRFNVTPADIGWFDDWSAVLSNARLAAAVARRGGSKGVCFDPEPYENRAFWNYAKQPDTTARGWSDHVAQARRRGAQLMEAFQDSFPDITVFTAFGVSMAYDQQTRHRVPPRTQDYGLLVPFMDGMVDAAHGRARIIEGFEGAYPVRDASEFARLVEQARGPMLSLVADRAKFRKVVSYGFGIWMDYDWQGKGWSTVRPDSNFRPPAQLEAVLRAALQASDEYVWLYSEKPRWWSEERGTRDLPEAYRNAVHRARERK